MSTSDLEMDTLNFAKSSENGKSGKSIEKEKKTSKNTTESVQ